MVIASLFTATSAHAVVKPKPWQWTTAQAGTAVVTWNPAVFPYTEGLPKVYDARCTGQGKAVQKRFTAFRCDTGFGQVVGGVQRRAVLWVKVRKAGKGQPCV